MWLGQESFGVEVNQLLDPIGHPVMFPKTTFRFNNVLNEYFGSDILCEIISGKVSDCKCSFYCSDKLFYKNDIHNKYLHY